MKVPIEVSFHDVAKDEEVVDLIHQKAQNLERVCDHISSCRVTIESASRRQRTGNAYHVRIDLTVPPGHELAVSRDPEPRERQGDLRLAIRRAFDAARRQVKELAQKQRGDIKQNPEQQLDGIIVRLFKDRDFGFLRDQSGRQLYFHRNSVLGNNFDRLEVGTGVHYFEHEKEGTHGPQASTVRIVDKPGVKAPVRAGDAPSHAGDGR